MATFIKLPVLSALAFGLALSLAALQATAASSAASTISESVGASVGSLSGSIQGSSDSSSRTTRLAAGEYRIVDIAQAADKPGTARLTLQAVKQQLAGPQDDGQGDDRFYLYLPQAAVEGHHLAVANIVTASQRPYGFEFAAGPAREAFFLVLTDEWYRELKTQRVTS